MTEPNATDDNEPRAPILLVYTGTEAGTDGKPFSVYLRVTPEQLEAGILSHERALFDAKSKGQRTFMMGSIGTVYEVEATPDGEKIYPGTAKYKTRWPDQAQIIQWHVASDARKAEAEAIAAREKASKFNEVREALNPIREAYQALPAMRRVHFLAQVVDYLNHKSK